MSYLLTLYALVALADKPSGPATVVTRMVHIAGAPSATLYHPALPGMKRMKIGGRMSRLLYEDHESNHYERITLEVGGSKRDLLQRIVTDAGKVSGEFRALAPQARTEYCQWAKNCR